MKKKHITFIGFLVTKWGLLCVSLALVIFFGTSYSVFKEYEWRQLAGIIGGVVFYLAASLSSIDTINKRIDKSELKVIEDSK